MPGLQVEAQILMSLLNMLYVVKCKPFLLISDSFFELGNELTVLTVLCCCIKFSDQSIDPLTASNFGFALIGVISLNIGTNLFAFISANIQLVYTKLKELYRKYNPE